MIARLVVHVQPRAKRAGIAGRHGDALKDRLSAPPADGAANDELVRLLAATLGVPPRVVTITAGHTARRKAVRVEGLTTADAVRRLLESAS